MHGTDYRGWCGVVHTVSREYVSNLGKREEYCDLEIEAIIESRCCDL
jgi:hypothetical protein